MRQSREVWRIWVNIRLRVVSFHWIEGWDMLEFRSWEMYVHAVDAYARDGYRYQ